MIIKQKSNRIHQQRASWRQRHVQKKLTQEVTGLSSNMAASLLSSRTALFFGVSKLNSFLPAVVQQIAHYNPRPLWLNIKSPYIPSKESEKTPEWQKTEKFERRLFGRYGGASGVDPAKLWPSHARLQELVAEEREWHPPIEVMLENIAAREREKEKRRMERWIQWLVSVIGCLPSIVFNSWPCIFINNHYH